MTLVFIGSLCREQVKEYAWESIFFLGREGRQIWNASNFSGRKPALHTCRCFAHFNHGLGRTFLMRRPDIIFVVFDIIDYIFSHFLFVQVKCSVDKESHLLTYKIVTCISYWKWSVPHCVHLTSRLRQTMYSNRHSSLKKAVFCLYQIYIYSLVL